VPDAPKALGFRSTWSVWNEPNPSFPRADSAPLPALEISRAAASRLLGADVDVLLAEMDADAKPLRLDPSPRRVHLRAESRTSDSLSAPNVVGVVPGSDPAFAKEFVIVGAHLDHIGVDTRGRLGLGADDNASGIAVVIEVAEAIALARPKRSVVFCAFSGEEDGLVGSYVFARDMQLDKNEVVAMLNADMVGRGPTDTLATLGVKQNPALEKLLKRAQKLSNTGIKKLSFDKAQHLWERSDHYSFHELGIPTLFFFEDPRGESKNPDYHTWRDTVELVDHDKVARTARLVFNAAWLLANDEERPPRPGR
jgi:Zn-dependent M28 family amino/carboxypeptidase